MPKKTARPRPLSGAGPGKGLGARGFRGPVPPVTNPRSVVALLFLPIVLSAVLTSSQSW